MSKTATPPPKPAAAPPKRPFPPLWQGALVMVLLGLAGGYLLSVFVFPPPKPEEKEETKDKKDKSGKEGKDTPPGPLDLAQIDELIEEGRFTQALDATRFSTDAKGAVLPPALTYRQALALEGLGRPADAAAAFRDCVSRGRGDHIRLAAQLGLARAALQRGLREEGREVLCAMLARAGKPAAGSRPYAADATCLIALSLADELQPPDLPAATRPGTLALSAPAPSPERYAGWDGPPPGAPAARTPWAATGALVVTQPKEEDAGPRVDASLGVTPVIDLLERLAKAAGLQLTWAPGAREALLGRSTELVCAAAELPDVALWLTMPFGLVVEPEKGAWRFSLASKLAPARRRAHREQLAIRLLRDALLTTARHPLSGNLYLALGNLEAAAGRLDEAANWYQRLGRERPASAAGPPAMYNLGMLRLGQGNQRAAREAFYQAIDRVPGHAMTTLCYWWIGRTHLDEGDTIGAQRPLLRAMQAAPRPTLSRASDPPAAPSPAGTAAPAAALALCCAFLLDGQPKAARDPLSVQQLALQREPFAIPSAQLDGIARFQLAGDNAKRRATIQAEVLSVLLSPREADWLGPILPLVRGKALGDMGLTDEMVRLFDRHLKTVRGPLADRMRFEAGEALARQGHDQAARKRLEPLAKAKSPPWSARAALRLAALDLQAGQPDRCLARCRPLVTDSGVERAAVLALMSKAYVQKKDYDRAAACLAGTVPVP